MATGTPVTADGGGCRGMHMHRRWRGGTGRSRRRGTELLGAADRGTSAGEAARGSDGGTAVAGWPSGKRTWKRSKGKPQRENQTVGKGIEGRGCSPKGDDSDLPFCLFYPIFDMKTVYWTVIWDSLF